MKQQWRGTKVGQTEKLDKGREDGKQEVGGMKGLREIGGRKREKEMNKAAPPSKKTTHARD